MWCVRCMSRVPEERVEFLRSQGREIVCLSCQEELEREGEYREYRGVIVTDRKGRYYDFAITTEDIPADPFKAYSKIRKPEVSE